MMADTIIALSDGYDFATAKIFEKIVRGNLGRSCIVGLLRANSTVYYSAPTKEYLQLMTQMMKDTLFDRMDASKEVAERITQQNFENMLCYMEDHHIKQVDVSTVCTAGNYLLLVHLLDTSCREKLLEIINKSGFSYTGVYTWFDDEINEESLEIACDPFYK